MQPSPVTVLPAHHAHTPHHACSLACRYGELDTRWVALDSWTFSLDFDGKDIPFEGLLASKEVALQLGGIDTFATVTLNGKQVLTPNNFHR